MMQTPPHSNESRVLKCDPRPTFGPLEVYTFQCIKVLKDFKKIFFSHELQRFNM